MTGACARTAKRGLQRPTSVPNRTHPRGRAWSTATAAPGRDGMDRDHGKQDRLRDRRPPTASRCAGPSSLLRSASLRDRGQCASRHRLGPAAPAPPARREVTWSADGPRDDREDLRGDGPLTRRRQLRPGGARRGGTSRHLCPRPWRCATRCRCAASVADGDGVIGFEGRQWAAGQRPPWRGSCSGPSRRRWRRRCRSPTCPAPAASRGAPSPRARSSGRQPQSGWPR